MGDMTLASAVNHFSVCVHVACSRVAAVVVVVVVVVVAVAMIGGATE